jgi:hypothetical protein
MTIEEIYAIPVNGRQASEFYGVLFILACYGGAIWLGGCGVYRFVYEGRRWSGSGLVTLALALALVATLSGGFNCLPWHWGQCGCQQTEYRQTFEHGENVSQIYRLATANDESISGMKNVRLFFASMFSELRSGLSGPASVPFAVLALFASSTVQKAAYGVLAAALLLFSTYRIWLKEHAALDEEKAKNQKPSLGGEILEVLIGPCEPAPTPPACASVVMLIVKAWNTVQMPEFTIYKYELNVTIAGPKVPATYTGIREGWTLNANFRGGFVVNHIAHELQPVRYIDAQKGFVPFYVDGLPPDTPEFISIVLTFIDAIGGRHPIKLGHGKFTSGGILAQKIIIPSQEPI